MTPNSLGPWYGVAAYHSAYGSHKMTIPTNDWTPGGDNGYGQYSPHVGGTPIDAMDMWEDLLTDIAEFNLATSVFDSVTIYSKPTQADPSVPVAVIPFAIAGTSVVTTQAKAAMSTWNFRTTAFGRFKLVLLDSPVASGFVKTYPADWGAEDLAILGALSDTAKGWCGRDGAAIQSGVSKTYKMSDALRKQYGMA